jgi:hypothetical protein
MRQQLVHLAYISRASEDFVNAASVDPRVIQVLSEKCNASNRQLGITGLLLYSRGRFLQLLEGRPEPVQELYAIILDDPRHTQIRKVLYGEVEAPMFKDWYMGVLDLSNARTRDREKLDLLIASFDSSKASSCITRASRVLLLEFRSLLAAQSSAA